MGDSNGDNNGNRNKKNNSATAFPEQEKKNEIQLQHTRKTTIIIMMQ